MPELKRDNPKIFETLNARLKELAEKEAAVGWFENARYEDGTPVAYVASINEFGRHARPFMRPTVENKAGSWAAIMGRGARAVLEHGEPVDSVLEKVARAAEDDIAQTITQITSPPLSPITILLRFWRRQGMVITGRTVGAAARAVQAPGYIHVFGV